MNREKAREQFQRCDLDYSMITLEDIDKLVEIVSEELQTYLEYSGEHAKNMNMKVSKLRKKDVKVLKDGLHYARIQVDGSYFKRREAITFSSTGFIGFGGELDDKNVAPILKAFCKWCEYVSEKSNVA
ncbi:hypothetical protein PQ478_09290 [Alkalihalophilus pseudofirmus]|uniref:hypothetical protein n=1 Tax=Alkalihalophilus pseudofirmus TaxID=79885 RepID=UPI00259B6917|nr:hypothetical protein [Alkalihalophilus pseudofirmus]WEG18663.1 hypothetical protein PQ478_09290 [Alkalihalophilus pseudofirmus]